MSLREICHNVSSFTLTENQLRFVHAHFKSCDQSHEKTCFDFSNIFRALQGCAMSAKKWHNTKSSQEHGHKT